MSQLKRQFDTKLRRLFMVFSISLATRSQSIAFAVYKSSNAE